MPTSTIPALSRYSAEKHEQQPAFIKRNIVETLGEAITGLQDALSEYFQLEASVVTPSAELASRRHDKPNSERILHQE